MGLTELRTLLDLAATYPYEIETTGKSDKFEVHFFDEEGDEEPIRTIFVNKEK